MVDSEISTVFPGSDLSLHEDILNEPGALLVLSGDEKGLVFNLNKDLMTGGRLPESEIHLSDGLLSRRHFQIIHDGTSYYLRDVRSANGTFLNERRLDTDSVLISGDVIRVGKTRLKFFSGNDPERAELENGSPQATTDDLTGCYTKNYLNSRLNRAFRRAVTEGKALSMLVFSFDAIEEAGRHHGDSATDILLSRAIQRIKDKGIRADDLLARYSEREFILLLEDMPRKRAKFIGDRLLELFQNKPLPYGSHRLQTTLSIGISELQPAMQNGAELFKQADYALYESRKHGGNRCTVFGVSSFEDSGPDSKLDLLPEEKTAGVPTRRQKPDY